MKKNALKALTACLAGIVLSMSPFCTMTAHAETGWDENTCEWLYVNDDYEDGHFIRQGGVNSLDGITTESREETEELEQYLQSHDYILCNSKDRDLTQEEFDLIKPTLQKILMFDEIVDEKAGFYYQDRKLYIYRPVYETIVQQIKESEIGLANYNSVTELALSAVVVDYTGWNAYDNIGRIYTDEYVNENLAKFDAEMGTHYDEHAGFLYITTNIDSRILFIERNTQTYQQVDVKKNEPLLIKIREGWFKIYSINGVPVSEDESLLGDYKNNNFKLSEAFTAENPMKINLVPVNEKYGITEDFDFEGDKMTVWQWHDIDPSGQEVEVNPNNTPATPQEKVGNIVRWIVIGGMGLTALILLIAYLYAKRKNKNVH